MLDIGYIAPFTLRGTGSLALGWPLTARSREVLKPWDSDLSVSNSSKIWQTPRQQRCRQACQTLRRYEHYDIQSWGFDISRDLAVRRLTAWWIKALQVLKYVFLCCWMSHSVAPANSLIVYVTNDFSLVSLHFNKSQGCFSPHTFFEDHCLVVLKLPCIRLRMGYRSVADHVTVCSCCVLYRELTT